MACASAVGTVGLLLINGTLSVARYDSRLDAAEKRLTDEAIKSASLEADRHERDVRRVKLADDLAAARLSVESLHIRMNSFDQRLAMIGGWIDDSGHRREDNAAALAAINARLGVLEAQSKFLGDFVHDNASPIRPAAVRR